MPHLDFRQAFASPSDVAPTVADATTSSSASEEYAILQQKRTLATRLPRLHQSDRTTILFAILVFVGGLFCAFYFFNGAEILRAAAAWSREFLYPRPSALMASNNRIDISNPGANSSQLPLQDSRRSDPARGNDTAPFGRNVGSLYPSSDGAPSSTSATAGFPSVTLPSGPGSLLGQLNLPPTNGGALAQTFDRAVAEIARVSSLYANAPIKVVQAPAAQTSRKVNAVKKTAQRPQNASAQTKAVQQNVRNVQERTSQTVRSMHLQDPTTVISGENLRGRLGGLGSGLGGSRLGGAMGGATGLGGGIGGAIGGATGGLGGIGK